MAMAQTESKNLEEESQGKAILITKGDADYIATLPKREGWPKPHRLYNNFWFPHGLLENVMLVQRHFKPRADDVLLVTHPKCGTTWLKALAFAITTRSRYTLSDHPLLNHHPQLCVPFLEAPLGSQNFLTDLDLLPSPRLISTHVPLSLLPPSAMDVGCRLVYLCRDPKDMFVSLWHFQNHDPKEFFLDMNKAFDMFCEGVSLYGPIWNHCLEYWKESLARPDKVLFLKYEDMIRDPLSHVQKLALFLGFPFGEEEEKNGAVEEIVRLCSFQTLKGLKENNEGVLEWHGGFRFPGSRFFRAGKVGDWVNHLSDNMARRLDGIVDAKLQGSGLKF